MQCCSAVLSEHLWPFSGSLAGWLDTTGPIYWQAEGWGNTSNWQRTSHPKPDLISTHTHTATLTPLWPHPSLCLSPLNSGNVRFVITDLRCVHAVGSHACHYAVWRFLSPCSSLSRPRKSEDWFLVGSCVCVCSVGEYAFLKLNPELTAVLFLSCWLAKDTGDYQGRGTKIQRRMREEKNGSMVVLKEGFLLKTLMGVRRKGHACWKPCGKTFGQRLETGAKNMQWLTSKGRTFEFTVPELYPLDLLYNATNYVDVNPVATSTSSYSEWY